MSWKTGYWTSIWQRRVGRRRLLGAATAGGVGLAGLALVGCGGGAGRVNLASRGEETPQSGGVLKGVLGFDVDTLDPLAAKSWRTNYVMSFVYSRLVKFATGFGDLADGTVEGDVAEGWEQPDETTVIFRLRSGAKWDPRPPTSGRGVTAEDVVLSWEKFASVNVYRADLVHAVAKDAAVQSVRSIDGRTVEMKLAFPDAELFPRLAFGFNFWIMPKESVAGGFNPNAEARGSGPWQLERYQPSVGFTFRKNPDWHFGPELPYADGVELPIIQDTAQAEAQFQAGNVQWGAVPVSDILTIHDATPDSVISIGAPDPAGPSISFGWRADSPFQDKRVRQAVSMLIDRDLFINTFYDAKGFQGAGVDVKAYWAAPFGAGFGPFWLDPKSSEFGPSRRYYEYRPDDAKKLLEAAGYPNGFETQLITLAGNEYGRDWSQRAEALASMLKQGGIRVKVTPVDYTTVWVPQFLRSKGDFDGMAMYANGNRADVGQWLSVFFTSQGANNQVGTNFPELDDMVAKQRGELDREKRISLVHDIQRWFAENLPAVPQGGSIDLPELSWKGLHGPGRVFHWPGGTPYCWGTELVPYYWLDESLRA